MSMEENSLNDQNQQLYFRLNFFKESDENFVYAFKTTYLPFNSAIKQEMYVEYHSIWHCIDISFSAVAVILSSLGIYIVQRKTGLLDVFKSDSQPGMSCMLIGRYNYLIGFRIHLGCRVQAG